MKINILLAIIFLSFIAYANLDYLHGITGMTLRDGGIGCVCHGTEPTISVNVWIEGPDSLIINQTAQYKLLMMGGPAIKGGFNVASYFGTLNSIDTLVSLISGELTHSSPNPFSNDTVSWNFSYTAPDSLTTDTIYSVANSVNGNGNPSQDQWNFGQNFVIHIIDNPVNIETGDLQPEDFVLLQNYPNPFNPSTTLSFVISNSSFVSLKVYDILGNEIAVLVNEDLDPGEYKVEFFPESSIQQPASGIYLYQFNAGSFVDTKKMILLK
jgi:hypothetical protein